MLPARLSVSWKTKLVESLAANEALPNAKYLQLATVREDGKPACRTVVFRGFLNDGENLTFVTDRRSKKVAEIHKTPQAEVCWYLPQTREQYRINGGITVVDESCSNAELLLARQKVWSNMSDGGRAMFTWPEPGAPRDPDPLAFNQPVPSANEAAVPTFCLVVMAVDEVEYVDLFKNLRIRFPKVVLPDGTVGWGEENINP